MKTIVLILGLAIVAVVLASAVMLLGLVIGWMSTDDVMLGLSKTLAITGIAALAAICIAGVGSLFNKK